MTFLVSEWNWKKKNVQPKINIICSIFQLLSLISKFVGFIYESNLKIYDFSGIKVIDFEGWD